MSATPVIELHKVEKWYGHYHALRDVNLTINRGEKVVVCGPSGSGKSTMIRCINRLEAHQAGRIVVNGTELTDDVKAVEAVRRQVGMVFQNFNLFPHLTILQNLTLAPIWVKGAPKAEIEEVALYLVDCHRNGDDLKAIGIWYAADTFNDNDERVYCWSLLGAESKLRAAIKANKPEERKAA